MEKLINALLNDENGISETAYDALCKYLAEVSAVKPDFDDGAIAISLVFEEAKEAKALLKLVKSADATDGRFYFSSES